MDDWFVVNISRSQCLAVDVDRYSKQRFAGHNGRHLLILFQIKGLSFASAWLRERREPNGMLAFPSSIVHSGACGEAVFLWHSVSSCPSFGRQPILGKSYPSVKFDYVIRNYLQILDAV